MNVLRLFSLTMLVGFFLAACTSLQSAPGAARAFKDAETIWSEYESDNFNLITDVSAAEAHGFLVELEDFRSFLRAELNPVSGRRPRLTVIAPKTRRGFSVFADPDAIGGLFFRTIDTDFMVINLSITPRSNAHFNGAFTAGDILRHEYTHAVVADLPGKPVPLWLNEGLAEYYATARRDGDDYIVGRPLEKRVEDLLRERGTTRQFLRTRRGGRRDVLFRSNRAPNVLILAPLDEIVDATSVSNVYRNNRDQTNYHAQAWLLTHQLVRSDAGREALKAYHEARQAIGEESKVLRDVLGEDLDDYDDYLWDIVSDADFPSQRVPAPPVPDVHVRRIGSVSEAQMWCNVARFKGFAADAREAKRTFRLALRHDPNNVCALGHLSKLESWDFNFKRARALTERAEALNLNDPFTPLSRAMLTYNLTRYPDFRGEIDDEDLDKAIDAAKRTIALDPGIALSHLVHGVLALRKSELSEGELCDALESVREAGRLAPQTQVTGTLLTGILAARAGRLDEAADSFAYVKAWTPSKAQREFATEYLATVNHLLNQETEISFATEGAEISPRPMCRPATLARVQGSDHHGG